MYVTTELAVVKDGASVRGRTPAGGGEGSALVRYQTPLVARRAGDAARRLPGRRGRLRGGRCSAGSPASRGNVSTVRGDFAMYIPAKVHGEAALDGDRHGISKGNMVVIPPGTEHDAINTSITEPLRLHIFYSPPDSASSPVTVREHGPRAPSPTGRSGVRSLPTRVKIVSKDDAAMQDHRKHDAEHLAMAAGHGGHGGGKTSGGHAGHDEHAGHATSTFRDRFWVSLVLSVPVVLYSEMVQMWFCFSMPRFAGCGLLIRSQLVYVHLVPVEHP